MANDSMQNNLITMDEIAATLQLTKASVRSLSRRKHDPLPLLKLGHRTLRAEKADFDAWVKRQQKADHSLG